MLAGCRQAVCNDSLTQQPAGGGARRLCGRSLRAPPPTPMLRLCLCPKESKRRKPNG
jgi:hypothetical protein